MKMIVGLGNPGREYRGTRHNVGFEVIDVLARRNKINVKSRRGKALIGEGDIGAEHVVLVKPSTFMNLSGQAVADIARRCHLKPSDIIVIADDVNLDLGRLRLRAQGSAGGHNGLKSIIYSLCSQEFARVRVGIGSPRREMVDFVLSRFSKQEQKIINEAIERAADAVEAIIEEGIEPAMNTFNALPSTE